MNITVKVKPYKTTGYSKRSLISKIDSNFATSYGSHGSALRGLGRYNGDVIRVYNLHKVNAKYKQGDFYKSGPKKGTRRKAVRVHDSYWVAYVYDFNKDVLKALGITVHQNDRNFTIKRRG